MEQWSQPSLRTFASLREAAEAGQRAMEIAARKISELPRDAK
jgi:hypothetical protein